MNDVVGIIYPAEKKAGREALSICFLQEGLGRLGIRSRVYFADSANLGLMSKHRLIVVSSHYENNYPMLLRMMERGGVSLHKQDRDFPKLLVGGPTTVNPMPLKHVADFFFIGDGEALFHALEEKKKRKGTLTLQEIMDTVIRHENVFHEGRGEIKTALCGLEGERSPLATVDGTVMIEVQRGCRRRCLFCLIGWTRGRCRYRSLDDIRLALSRVRRGSVNRVMLIGSDPFSNPELPDIITYLRRAGYEIGMPSIHVSDIQEYRDVLKLIRPRTITIAPESSERIRFELGKKFSDEDVLRAARTAKLCGARNLKLYFMVGLPAERDKDLEACANLVNLCSSLSGMRVKCTFSIFIPKPHTPMQFAPFEGVEALSARNKLLRKKLRVRAHFTNPKRAAIQTLLSIGDERVGKILLQAYRHGLSYTGWVDAARKLGLKLEDYFNEKTPEYVFGFECINTSVCKRALYSAYQKYLAKTIE